MTKLTKKQTREIQELCGEYVLLKHRLVELKLKIIRRAKRLGIGDALAVQMEW